MSGHASSPGPGALPQETPDREPPGRRTAPLSAAWWRRIPVHPILFAIFPILILYAHNIAEVPAREIWRPLGVSLLASAAAWAVCAALTKNGRKAALVTSALSLVFFSYGHFVNLLPESQHSAAPLLCIVGLAAIVIALVRSRGPLIQATTVVNLAAIALIAPSCLSIGSWLIERASNPAPSAPMHSGLANAAADATRAGAAGYPSVRGPAHISPEAAAALPDIYYIILDAYGRADSLREFYGYDNTPFVRELEKRGFYVTRQSHANYAQTGYCLPASLNMCYLDSLISPRSPADDRFEMLRRRIDDNAVAGYLRGQGYHYVDIWTGAAITRVDTADLTLDNEAIPPPTSFAGEVFSLSALGAGPATPQMRISNAVDYDQHRGFIRTAFHNLPTVAPLPYPKFVFAHILAPHPPFVFGPRGEPVDPPYPYNDADGSQLMRMHKITRQDYKRGYIDQLQYINKRVLEAVDGIIRQSRRPPIIIVQGDHGSRLNVDWESQARTDLREPFSILNAYLVPPRVRRNLYDTITPVNSFRVLFNSLFGASYPLLPDRSYFATVDRPLDFVDVTHLIPGFPPPSK